MTNVLEGRNALGKAHLALRHNLTREVRDLASGL